MYILDTNICIYAIKRKYQSVLEKFKENRFSGDTLIAAHARSLNLILVTNNTREFSRVQGLDLENWA